MARPWRLIAQLALGGAVIAAFPSAGSAVQGQFAIALTPSGPLPDVATLGAGALSPLWTNQDQVTHTVAFANGLCSLQIAPGDSAQCGDDFFAQVGRYPYTVDGTVQASVIVRLNRRTVTLTARRHTITRGTMLALHGELFAAQSLPGPPRQPVIVLARHDRQHAFRRVAVVRARSEVGRGRLAIWRLRVRVRTSTTTYIAEAKSQPHSGLYWQNARSKPFVVRGRPAGGALAGGAASERESRSGLVFRYYRGSGWQFQPLLSFEHLNNLVTAGRALAARRLVEALLARGQRQGAALYWRYDFPYGGPVPWSSGFVQAIATQALARASRLLERPALLGSARAALRGLRQGLLLRVDGGLWIREYGFTRQVILNSQLQSLLSLHSYARLVATPQAARLVQSLYRATVRLLPRFDLGCHSLYQLGGPVADHHYQDYHVALLKRLAGLYPEEPLFGRLYMRWRRCA
jgi:D-glucuronyl C5-epimerase C-terminus